MCVKFNGVFSAPFLPAGNAKKLVTLAECAVYTRPGTASLKVAHGPVPRSLEASSYMGSNRLNTANIISRPNGSVHVSCVPMPHENKHINYM